MSAITTHVLDLSIGQPARGLRVSLTRLDHAGAWTELGDCHTDVEGRAKALLREEVPLTAGMYRLHFDLGAYFAERHVEAFFPEAEVTFAVRDPTDHYHVPLLVSPFGYSTYRGT